MKTELIYLRMTVKREDIMYTKKIMKLLSLLDMDHDVYRIYANYENYRSSTSLQSPISKTFTKNKIVELLNSKKLLINWESIELGNDHLNISIKSTLRIAGFAEICLYQSIHNNEIFKYRDILMSFFKYQFYSCYIRKLNFKKYDDFLYRNIGMDFDINYYMAFGPYSYDFIPKEKLLSYKHAYHIEEKHNVIHIWLFKHMINEPYWKERYKIKQFIRKMGIEDIVKEINECVYWDRKVCTHYIRGYEDYSPDYIKQMCETWGKKSKSKNQYEIELLDNIYIILKKYKKTHFYQIEENVNATEIVGFFVYTRDGNEPSYNIYDSPARLIIEISCIHSTVEKYCERNNYSYEKIDEYHYLLTKEENDIYTLWNYYVLPEDQLYYDIILEVNRKQLPIQEIESLVKEYNRLIKYMKIKRT